MRIKRCLRVAEEASSRKQAEGRRGRGGGRAPRGGHGGSVDEISRVSLNFVLAPSRGLGSRDDTVGISVSLDVVQNLVRCRGRVIKPSGRCPDDGAERGRASSPLLHRP